MQQGDRVVFSSLESLIHLKAQVTLLQSVRHRSWAKANGGYRTVFKGRGMDFAESRPYQAGDDIRSIDWRVTARSGKLHTKIFQEERERPVLLWVDLRSAMFFATQGRFKSVLAAEVAAVLTWKTLADGDRIGGVIQNNTTHFEVKPLHSQRAALHLLGHIADNTQLQPHTKPVVSILEESWARLRRVASSGTQVVLISDFRGSTPQALRQLALIARHCEVTLIHIHDPFEQHIPANATGRLRLTDGGRSVWINLHQRWKERYAQQASIQLHDLQNFARRYRLRFISLSTEHTPTERLTALARGLS